MCVEDLDTVCERIDIHGDERKVEEGWCGEDLDRNVDFGGTLPDDRNGGFADGR